MNTATMVKTLVVYEVIPEETKMAVVDLSQEQFDFLSHAHGYIVNASDVYDPQAELACRCVDSAFCDDVELIWNDEPEVIAYFNKFKDCKLDTQDLTGVQKIISCGFYL